MLSKNQIKHITSLHLKKNREKEKLFIAEGVKVVSELLHSSFNVHSIFATDAWTDQHAASVKKSQAGLYTVTEAELKKISALTTPNQVLAVASMPHYSIDMEALKHKLTLVLDDIKDPGNLGTIIRIADWFGIGHVICSETTVDIYNPKVIQATMGSAFRVQVFYTDLAALLKDNHANHHIRVFAAAMKGESIYEAELERHGIILLGNESNGVSKQLLHYADHTITIPSFSHHPHHAESLNVAIAAAIFCSEFRTISSDYMI